MKKNKISFEFFISERYLGRITFIIFGFLLILLLSTDIIYEILSLIKLNSINTPGFVDLNIYIPRYLTEIFNIKILYPKEIIFGLRFDSFDTKVFIIIKIPKILIEILQKASVILLDSVIILLIIQYIRNHGRNIFQGGFSNFFINIISFISIGGVTIGVAALFLVLAIMNGFESEVKNRILGFDAHIRLRAFHDQGIDDYRSVAEKIRDIPEITGISPYIMDKGMIRNREYTTGIIVKAADQATVTQVSDIDKNIVYGTLDLNQKILPDGRKRYGIVLGKYLADQILADTNDVVMIMSPKGIRSMFQVPEVMPFIVTGFFETGMFEYDNTYAYISIEAAQQLFKYDQKVSGLEIRLKDINQANNVAEKINKKLGFPYFPITWFEMRQNLFHWMQLEKIAMFLILCLIIIVAAFNILSTLVMMVMEKTREIGILKSMGSTSFSIYKIFIYESLVIGISGALLGRLIGKTLCLLQIHFHIIKLPGDVYFLSTLPVEMHFLDSFLISFAAIVICLLAGLIPAIRAATLDPVKAIRYE